MSTIIENIVHALCEIQALHNQNNRTALLHTIPENLAGTIPRSESLITDLNVIICFAKKWGYIPVCRKYALDIVIEKAITFVQGTEQEETISTLRHEYLQSREVIVQVVVAAMTRTEAEQLKTEHFFNDPDDYNHWKNMKTALQNQGINDFSSFYGESRDEWLPLITDEGLSIQKIMHDFVRHLNEWRNQKGELPVELRFLSSDFLSSNIDNQCCAISIFEQFGGIIIIDAISMCHPVLRYNFLKSGILGGNNPVSVTVISPLKKHAFKQCDKLEESLYNRHMKMAFNRFYDLLDPHVEFGIGDICNLRRWLSLIFLADRKKRGLCPDTRGVVRTATGITPKGISSFIVR